jgi:hypothetical protein
MGTVKSSIKYALLPGIIPRLSDFFRSGFMHVAFGIALVYYNVGLLPAGHPYTNPVNIGRYGIRHVIAEAARNLKWSWRHIDQILIFFTILIGVVLLALQALGLVIALITTQPASAAGFALGCSRTPPAPEIRILPLFCLIMCLVWAEFLAPAPQSWGPHVRI